MSTFKNRRMDQWNRVESSEINTHTYGKLIFSSTSLIIKEMQTKPQWGAISGRSEWLQTINAGEGAEKKEPSYTVGGNADWHLYCF